MRFYPALFTHVLRKFDPEFAHHVAFRVIQAAPILGPILRSYTAPNPQLRVNTLGVTFPSPFGLAAGFDKNAEAITGIHALGFGHVEVGTLTKHAQPGNPKPRMFRVVADRGLINRMGFNNGGSAGALARIEGARLRAPRPIIGINIGKSKITPVEDAIADYVYSAQRLAPVADYLAVNVSSPNTPGLRGLQELDQLQPLLEAVFAAAAGTPLLVKIAPDMDDAQITAITKLAKDIGLAGIIATNTTVVREGLLHDPVALEGIGAGGLSGAPLKERSLEVLQVIREAVADVNFCVVSVGGVETAKDVLVRLQAGATLVQGYTGFIYEGPLWAKQINEDLYKLGWRGNA